MNSKEELIKIKINYLTTELTCLWSTGALTFGSSFLLLMNKASIANAVIGLAGIIISLFLFNGFFAKRTVCHKLIRDFENGVLKNEYR